MFYTLPLDELSSYSGKSVDVLKNYSYTHLEKLVTAMRKKKAEDEAARNAADQEFARLVRKYFTPYQFLKTWWPDKGILFACSKHLTKRDLVQEQAVKNTDTGAIRYYERPESNAEFLRESVESVPTYDKRGRQYMESERVKCRVYRIKHQYQGLRHGKVILELLYDMYPELKHFDFSAYEFNDYKDSSPYEIYPKNHIMTSFKNLMDGDVEAIKKRNLDYAKSYNNGFYTVENMTKLFESEEGKRFFEVIQNLAR